jgi:hypothetical protein
MTTKVSGQISSETTEPVGVDRSPVLDAARFRAHSSDIGTKCFEHHVALSRVGRDDGENMDHGCSLLDHLLRLP